MSSLPTTRYCGAAGRLNAEHGSGRAAAMSSALHARLGGADNADALWARLSEAERAEVDSWKSPEPFELDGRTYEWADATREDLVELGLPNGQMATGHPDAFWFAPDGGVIVADLKRSRWTTEDGPESLQLIAYALAVLKPDTPWLICGIWSLTEGGWQWGARVDLTGFASASLYETVAAAALSDPEVYSTGPHCQRCYGRRFCGEYLLPVAHPESAIAVLREPGQLVSADQVLRLHRLRERLTEVLDVAKSTVEAWVVQNGPLPDENGGKVLRQVMTGPGTSVDMKALEAAHPDIVAKYSRTTPPRSNGFRWAKP
jgi:hypothetical protein